MLSPSYQSEDDSVQDIDRSMELSIHTDAAAAAVAHNRKVKDVTEVTMKCHIKGEEEKQIEIDK